MPENNENNEEFDLEGLQRHDEVEELVEEISEEGKHMELIESTIGGHALLPGDLLALNAETPNSLITQIYHYDNKAEVTVRAGTEEKNLVISYSQTRRIRRTEEIALPSTWRVKDSVQIHKGSTFMSISKILPKEGASYHFKLGSGGSLKVLPSEAKPIRRFSEAASGTPNAENSRYGWR